METKIKKNWKKKHKLIETEQIGDCRVDKMHEVGEKVQTFFYKIVSHGDVMYNMEMTVNKTVMHISKSLRVHPQSSHDRKKNFLYMVTDVNYIMLVIYISITSLC